MSDWYIGATLPVRFPPVPRVEGGYVDLTGASVVVKMQRMGIADAPEVQAETAAVIESAEAPGEDEVRVEFSPAQTAELVAWKLYQVDGIATLPTGKVVPLGSVTFTAKPLISVD